jgi:hypothetical protein
VICITIIPATAANGYLSSTCQNPKSEQNGREDFEVPCGRRSVVWATNGGALVPDSGAGEPVVHNASRPAGFLGDRPVDPANGWRMLAPPDTIQHQEAVAFLEQVRLETNGCDQTQRKR